MNRIKMMIVVIAGALAIQGCDSDANKVVNTAGRGFELTDVSDQTIKQAADDTIRVAIDRKGGFTGEVRIDVSGLPAGVEVEGGNSKVILANDSVVNLKLLARDTATPTEKNNVMLKASANVDGQTLSKTDNFNLTVKARS